MTCTIGVIHASQLITVIACLRNISSNLWNISRPIKFPEKHLHILINYPLGKFLYLRLINAITVITIFSYLQKRFYQLDKVRQSSEINCPHFFLSNDFNTNFKSDYAVCTHSIHTWKWIKKNRSKIRCISQAQIFD